MAWFAAALPYIEAGVAVAGTAAQMQNQQNQAKFQAKSAELEDKVNADQAAREEEATRRDSDAFFGRQRAAIAESGLGYGGTTGMLVDQGAKLAELDALNVRYSGGVRGAGLLSESRAARVSGKAAGRTGSLLAGAQLLNSGAKIYARS